MAYARILGEGSALPTIVPPGARDALTAFARETQRQHAEHRRAFQAQTTALAAGARVQDAPNPKFLPLVDGADLSTPERVVDLATTLEKVATDTYLTDLALLQDQRAKAVVAGVLAVEAQHLAVLRTVTALLRGGAPHLVAVPFPRSGLMHVPVPVGGAAFPGALHAVDAPELIAEPGSGAVG